MTKIPFTSRPIGSSVHMSDIWSFVSFLESRIVSMFKKYAESY